MPAVGAPPGAGDMTVIVNCDFLPPRTVGAWLLGVVGTICRGAVAGWTIGTWLCVMIETFRGCRSEMAVIRIKQTTAVAATNFPQTQTVFLSDFAGVRLSFLAWESNGSGTDSGRSALRIRIKKAS